MSDRAVNADIYTLKIKLAADVDFYKGIDFAIFNFYRVFLVIVYELLRSGGSRGIDKGG